MQANVALSNMRRRVRFPKFGYKQKTPWNSEGYALCIAVDPADQDHVFIGNIELHETVDGSISVATFNDGYSSICVDDNCWIIKNGNGFSSHIFEEAMIILKQLPDNPSNYKPYVDYISQPMTYTTN